MEAGSQPEIRKLFIQQGVNQTHKAHLLGRKKQTATRQGSECYRPHLGWGRKVIPGVYQGQLIQ